MDANVLRAERMISLLSSTYLANSDAVKANAALVIDTVLSQNLLAYVNKPGINAEVARRYDAAVQKWAARINSLVIGKTPDSRAAGTMLMKTTVLQSPHLLLENSAKWTTSVLNNLAKSDITPVHQASLRTLLTIMDIVREVPVLHREVASAQIPRMNQAILVLAEKNADLVDDALNVLTYSASWFPSLFRPTVDKVESLCLKTIGEVSARSGTNVCKRAAECLAALCVVSGKLTTDERWFQYTQMALGTIENCIDFVMCKDSMQGDTDNERVFFGLPAFAADFIESIPQAVDRIGSMVELLKALLTRPVAVDLPIPVDAIVAVASKLALVPMRAATSKSTRAEFNLVCMLAPEIQRAAIRILATMAITLGSYMIPYVSSVARTVAVINSNQAVSAPVKVAMYALVRLYVEKYDYGFALCLPRDFFESVLDDIDVRNSKQQASTAITATSQASALGLSGSKKRNGNGKARVVDSNITEEDAHTPMIQWTDVTFAAFKATLAFLRYTPTILSPSNRTRIDGQVLTLIMLDTIGGYESPFANRQVDTLHRVVLYECLQASVISPDPWHRSILQHALTVFNAGLMDASQAIRNVCLQAISAVDPMVHARLPAQMRAPDDEKNVESERMVSGAMFNGEYTVGSALSGLGRADQSDISTPGGSKRLKRQNGVVDGAQYEGSAVGSVDNASAVVTVESQPPSSYSGINAAFETTIDNSANAAATEAAVAKDENTKVPVVSSQLSFASFSTQPVIAASDPVVVPNAPAAAPVASFVSKPTTQASISQKPQATPLQQSATKVLVASTTSIAATGNGYKGGDDDNDDDDDDDAIPDIVMDGSDSEDEDM
ncbi:hypothetical protein GGI07_004089 [Coemansia sp. Benny D115]|nr:hypothetical protein GGI07_004089 [Coemansia sp. Benny D115]